MRLWLRKACRGHWGRDAKGERTSRVSAPAPKVGGKLTWPHTGSSYRVQGAPPGRAAYHGKNVPSYPSTHLCRGANLHCDCVACLCAADGQPFPLPLPLKVPVLLGPVEWGPQETDQNRSVTCFKPSHTARSEWREKPRSSAQTPGISWKNCLPWNQSLMPKRLGIIAIEYVVLQMPLLLCLWEPRQPREREWGKFPLTPGV